MKYLMKWLLLMSALPVWSGTQGLYLDWLDQRIAPGQDFFTFANGGWQKTHPIPAPYARWGQFYILAEHNQQVVHQLLQEAAKKAYSKPGSIEQKIGDFYLSGMNEVAINQQGIQPLQDEFNRIDAIQNGADLQKAIAHLQRIGVNVLFHFGQMQDFNDSHQVIAVATQDGLGLPDRDYYLKQTPAFQQIRHQYQQHMVTMFKLMGDADAQANVAAKIVMHIETTLAQASMSRIAQRDPHAIYHVLSLATLGPLTPHFSWTQYLSDMGRPDIKQINMAMPTFFKIMDQQLKVVTLDNWKVYLRWHLLDATAPFLSAPFVNEDFHMRAILTGARALQPRWQRVVQAANDALGFAIGKRYVEKMFSPAAKTQASIILHDIRQALKEALQQSTWMDPATRAGALKKLNQMEERIGYPDRWRDYTGLTIDRGPYVLNVLRANAFLTQYELNKIGRPVDRSEWSMTPQTVNAYYDPSLNQLNIPAGLLQPPFFARTAPAAVNYGAIGFVIGHEMTHGFDDQGAQFDGEGRLKNWWTNHDLQAFQAMTRCIATQFSRYTVLDQVHVQGPLVVGEAAADLGGLTLAYRAFRRSTAYPHKTIRSFTPEQQFFLGAAHIWASLIRPEEARRLVVIDPHPPAQYRVNGTFANMPAFQAAYHLSADSAMINVPRCMTW